MTEHSTEQTQVDYAARRRERATQRSLERRQALPVAGIIAVLAVVLLLVAGEALASWGRVHPGVTVAGVRIGGMKPDSARSALKTSLPGKASARPVVLTAGEKSWKVEARDVGVDFDYDAMIADAMSVGRDRNVLAALGGRLDAWIGGKSVAARPLADQKKLTEVLDRVAAETDVEPVDARVDIDGGSASVVPGKDGRGLQRGDAERVILTALVSDKRSVEMPIGVVKVVISDADAQAAAAVATQMLSGPATVTFGEKSWKFDAEDIGRMIAFRGSDEPVPSSTDETQGAQPDDQERSAETTLIAFVSPDGVATTVVPAVGAKVGRPAKDATFKTANGVVTIVPSQTGIGPDVDALATDLTNDLTNASSDRTVEMRMADAEPEITTEEAKAMGVHERISRFTTTYDAGNRSRVNNIHLLGDALDGKLIAPGATFSFNGAVGERTAAKGYQEANAIVNGKLVPQLGGGICQVGTTLFNTIFESGLPVIQRHNHSFYISHYPKGRDATVSWGGPDLKFKNDTESWMLLSVAYTSSSITISLYGTDPGYEVESETSDWTNIKPYSTETIKDNTMKVGQKIVEDKGITGRTCIVTRKVYKGGQVLRTDTFKSVYKPKVEVVRVGTKPKSGSKTTTATAN